MLERCGRVMYQGMRAQMSCVVAAVKSLERESTPLVNAEARCGKRSIRLARGEEGELNPTKRAARAEYKRRRSCRDARMREAEMKVVWRWEKRCANTKASVYAVSAVRPRSGAQRLAEH